VAAATAGGRLKLEAAEPARRLTATAKEPPVPRRHLLAIAVVLLTAASAPGADVGVQDPAVTYVGRFDFSQAGVARASWPGTSVKLRFSGTGVSATLHTLESDWAQVVVDGKPTTAIELAKTATPYVLAEGLADGEHTVEVVKRTEAWSIMSFGGFQIQGAGKALPAPKGPQRRIEIYGDSITCGYGNEARSAEEHFSPANSNAYLAYGPVAARAVGAECSLIAVSGIKLWPANHLPPRHDDVLRPWDDAGKADFKAWVADAVVINLGTNDFGGGAPDEQGWTDAMRAFVKTIRGHYPDCHVYLATGSMMTGEPLATLKRYLDQVVADATRAGDQKIHRLDFDPQQMSDGIGADWHPSVKTDQKMGEKLAAALRNDLNWK
jgi:lysophospholipase L1-like esterase